MIKNDWLKASPLYVRHGIPIFVEKDPAEVQADRYERYWEVVVRQLWWHYGDHWDGVQGFSQICDYIRRAIGEDFSGRILEIGGGVGRLSGELALRFPGSEVAMVDYSYNMLRSAQDIWLNGKKIPLDGRHLGWPKLIIEGRKLPNIWLGQARGEELPFHQETMDVVLSTFFIDRAANLEEAIREQVRVLRMAGRLIIVSPLNFQNRQQWEQFGDPMKLTRFFREFGLRQLDYESEILCQEPLDARGNAISWRVAGWIFEKVSLPVVKR